MPTAVQAQRSFTRKDLREGNFADRLSERWRWGAIYYRQIEPKKLKTAIVFAAHARFRRKAWALVCAFAFFAPLLELYALVPKFGKPTAAVVALVQIVTAMNIAIRQFWRYDQLIISAAGNIDEMFFEDVAAVAKKVFGVTHISEKESVAICQRILDDLDTEARRVLRQEFLQRVRALGLMEGPLYHDDGTMVIESDHVPYDYETSLPAYTLSDADKRRR